MNFWANKKVIVTGGAGFLGIDLTVAERPQNVVDRHEFSPSATLTSRSMRFAVPK